MIYLSDLGQIFKKSSSLHRSAKPISSAVKANNNSEIRKPPTAFPSMPLDVGEINYSEGT